MTPKERLKRLESYSVCDNYREKEEDFKEIEKALEVLEIIKEHYILFIEEGQLYCGRCGDIEVLLDEDDFDSKQEFNLLKEWLRNEQNG